MEQAEWEQLSADEKKRHLYITQIQMLKGFLERNAISKEQYEKSFHDLTKKMGIQQPLNTSHTAKDPNPQ